MFQQELRAKQLLPVVKQGNSLSKKTLTFPTKVGFWSRLPDSNWGPSIYKIVALPTELRRRYYFLHLLIRMFFSLYAFTQAASLFLVFGNCYQEAGNVCLFSGLLAFLYYFIAYLFYLFRDFVCASDPQVYKRHSYRVCGSLGEV